MIEHGILENPKVDAKTCVSCISGKDAGRTFYV